VVLFCWLFQIADQIEGRLGNGSVNASSSFVPSLGVSSSELHGSSDLKYLVDRRCCLRCSSKSRVSCIQNGHFIQ